MKSNDSSSGCSTAQTENLTPVEIELNEFFALLEAEPTPETEAALDKLLTANEAPFPVAVAA